MIADEIRAVTKNYKSIRFNGELLALADRVEAVERERCPNVQTSKDGIRFCAELNKRLNQIDVERFWHAPCYLCGYNGEGYFQPSNHPCAERYHAAIKEQADAKR